MGREATRPGTDAQEQQGGKALCSATQSPFEPDSHKLESLHSVDPD